MPSVAVVSTVSPVCLPGCRGSLWLFTFAVKMSERVGAGLVCPCPVHLEWSRLLGLREWAGTVRVRKAASRGPAADGALRDLG